jgi:hypothetical protein
MVIQRERDPKWVAEQLIADNEGETLYSGRFEIIVDKMVAEIIRELQAAGAHAERDGSSRQVVVEFAAALVHDVARIAVAKDGILLQSGPRM